MLLTAQKEKMVARERNPVFIKPYFPPNSRISLKLPSPFTSFVKEILPLKVLLRDHYDGSVWAVEVAKVGSDLFFQAGWTKFLEDNSLEFGDLLFFQYKGGDEFSFKILRATAKRRDVTGAMDFSSNEGLQEDDEENEAVHEETGNNRKNKPGRGNELVELELEEGALLKKFGERRTRSSGSRTRKLRGSSTSAQGKVNAVRSSNQDFKPKLDGLQNPYFLVKRTTYKANEVYVPQAFLNALGVQLREKMIIRDPTGREWSTKFYTRKNKTTWLLGGWKLIALHNNVKEEDCLACELVPSRDQPGSYYIQLHIHRMT